MSEQLAVPASTRFLSIIQIAVEKGAGADQLERLFAMQERMEMNDARREFAEAFRQFKAEAPAIVKKRVADIKSKNDGKGFNYNYASLDDITEVIDPILGRVGISYSFDSNTDAKPGFLRLIVKLRKGIYVESSNFDMPMPTSATGNNTQAFGAGLSYARRYGLCAALGITVTDHDNDAQGLLETLSEVQLADVKALIETARADPARICTWAASDTLENIPAKLYAPLVELLKKKASERK